MESDRLRALALAARAALEKTVRRSLEALRARSLPGAQGMARDRLLHALAQEGEQNLAARAVQRFFWQLAGVRYMEANDFLQQRVFPLLLGQSAAAQEALCTRLFRKTCAAWHDKIPDFFPVPDCVDLLLPLESGAGAAALFAATPDALWRGNPAVIAHLQQCVGQAAAARLPVPEWAVAYLVQNSVGRAWLQAHPDSPLRARMAYYMPDAVPFAQRRAQTAQPHEAPSWVENPLWRVAIRATPRVFAPCMGCGQLLAGAFDLLLQMYAACDVPPRQAARLILEHNLWGIDTDRQAAKVSIFVLLMKARAQDAQLFARPLRLHVYAAQGSEQVRWSTLRFVAGQDEVLDDDLRRLVRAYRGAAAYGALSLPPKVDLPRLCARFDSLALPDACSGLFDGEARADAMATVRPLVEQSVALCGQYDAVLAVPPVPAKMPPALRRYVNTHWLAYNGALFSAYMVRMLDFCQPQGYCACMTPYVWMFLKSYQPLRALLLRRTGVSTLAQMGEGALAAQSPPACAFVLRNAPETAQAAGLYLRLTDVVAGDAEALSLRLRKAAAQPERPWAFRAHMSDFALVPGSPFAYWTGAQMARVFQEGAPLGKIADVRNGLFTCDNGRFLRLWWEVPPESIDFSCADAEECRQSPCRWFPYNKGGPCRKWYGNQDWVVDFAGFGAQIRRFRARSGQSAALPGRQRYFQSSISWGYVSSSRFSARVYPQGFVFDVAGSSLFPPQGDRLYRLAFLNSSTAWQLLRVLNPTANCQAGDMARLPILEAPRDREHIERLTRSNILLAKQDWDDLETSWHFIQPPLLRAKGDTLAQAQADWACAAQARLAQLRSNEEAINRHFAQLYGTGAPVEVPQEEVGVRLADPARDMRSLVSFFVGVYFGRWDCAFWRPASRRPLLAPAQAAALFAQFLQARFGPEAPVQAAALLGRGAPQASFQRYFARGFFRDHCQVYHKRPIYWQLAAAPGALLYAHGDVPAALQEASRLQPEDAALRRLAQEAPSLDLHAGISACRAELAGILRKVP